MNLFKRIFDTIPKDNIRPLENFTTEILANILEQNQAILEKFANLILGIEGTNFSIFSQKKYLQSEKYYIIDLVVINESSLCFIENKVNADLREDQLEDYKKVLMLHKKEKNTYLRYCSKYFDNQIIKDIDFAQFRWRNVSLFLSEYQDNQVINEFINFLTIYNMNNDTIFNPIDLVCLENIGKTLDKIKEYQLIINEVFKANFPNTEIKEFNYLKKEYDWSYKTNLDNIFSEQGDSNFYFGFYFRYYQPIVSVSIWCGDKNLKVKEFRSICKKNEYDKRNVDGKFYVEENELYIQKPLVDFFCYEDKMEFKIREWFDEQFRFYKNFIEETPELNWHKNLL